MLIGLAEWVGGSADERTGFVIAIVSFGVWSVGVLTWVSFQPIRERFFLLTAAVDIAAITALVYVSGGGLSQTRIAFGLVPISLAFRFRPRLTLLGGVAAIVAYLAQAFGHPSGRRGGATDVILLQAGYLAWISVAAALLTLVLARRTRRVGRLVEQSRHLLADALRAEERERQSLAERLHDNTLQNLLSIRHEIQEASEAIDLDALDRAESLVSATTGELRGYVSELHPLAVEQAGLDAALSAVAAAAGRRGGFDVHVACSASPPLAQSGLLLSAARELLANAATHAAAGHVDVRCWDDGRWITMTVIDDGIGFDPTEVGEHAVEGHIGLASQRARVEAAGGLLTIQSSPGDGTTAVVSLPVDAEKYPPPPGVIA